MSISPRIEAALAASAERLRAGSGTEVVRHLRNDLAMIDTSSDDLSRRYADEDVALAVPVVFEAKRPEGDPVTVGKRHDGLIGAFHGSFIVVREMGFGAREVKALRTDEVAVEPVTLVLDGVSLAGLRLADSRGKPKFALAVALPDATCDADAQRALRDELATHLVG